MSNQGYTLTKDVTFHTAAVLTANGEHVDVKGFQQVMLQIVGINADTVTFEVTLDGTNWVALRGINLATGVVATTSTVNGIFLVTIAGASLFRARLTRVAGTVTITGRISTGIGGAYFIAA